MLAQTLRAIESQTVPVHTVVVVDNDSDSSLRAELGDDLDDVCLLAMPDNLGYGAGLAHGMRHLLTHVDPDWYWLMDDDSPPGHSDLEEALAVATGPLEPDVVANRGGHLSFGRIRHDLHAVSRPEIADFALVDGALISRAAVQRAGFPREDLFMMHEDLEYTSRIVRTGGTVVVRPARPAARHLGSAAPWRCYYQARNHLRIALDRRSVTWVVGWIDRMVRLTVADVLRGRWAHLGLRWRGARDALRNRMGRTIGPSTP